MTFTLLLLLPILSILQQFWISSVIRVYSGRSSRGERRTQHPFKFLRNISIEDPEKWRKNLKSIWDWKKSNFEINSFIVKNTIYSKRVRSIEGQRLSSYNLPNIACYSFDSWLFLSGKEHWDFFVESVFFLHFCGKKEMGHRNTSTRTDVIKMNMVFPYIPIS